MLAAFLAALVATAGPVRADEPAKDKGSDKPAVEFSLTVDPAAEPVPSLKYQLLPPIERQLPGNAAPIYLRILHEQGAEWRKRLTEEPSTLLEAPAADFATGKIFREKWELRWSPQIEAHLVEQNLYGDTIESAVVARFREGLAKDEAHAGPVP